MQRERERERSIKEREKKGLIKEEKRETEMEEKLTRKSWADNINY